MALKQVTREQWTTALRSGEYNQGRGCLYDKLNQGYCCLGVLGAIAGGDIDLSTPCGMSFEGWDSIPENAFLPVELTSQVGISRRTQHFLVDMNDGDHKTFKEIADYIDSLPEVDE